VDNILVIGDVMLDCYYWGRTTRISPEAPVPLFELDEVTYVLGGAANVAANVSSLGGNWQTAILMGLVGKDREGEILKSLVRDIGITDYLVSEKDRPTTTKTRVVAAGQHMLRIDCENTKALYSTSSNTTHSRMKQVMSGVGAVIISDYAKGMISNAIAVDTIHKAFAEDVPVFVDPKGIEWSKYVDAFCVTPNLREFIYFYNATFYNSIGTISEVAKVAPSVAAQYGWNYLVVTLGAEGILVAEANTGAKVVSAKKVEVADVSGAGDTVIASFATKAASLEDPKEINMIRAAEQANAAAAVAVSKLGTVAVSIFEVGDTW
jgi:rfaE bifunctional protein kinase chain/domain